MLILAMFICLVLSIAAFILQWQSWVVEIETIWPAKLKHLLSGELEKKFTDPSLKRIWKLGLTPEFEKAQML